MMGLYFTNYYIELRMKLILAYRSSFLRASLIIRTLVDGLQIQWSLATHLCC